MRPGIRTVSALILLLSVTGVVAQTEERPLKKPEDSARECKNHQEFRKAGADELILPAISWGNNPQEGEYRREVERLLKLEIQNVNTAILDVVSKHKELIKLYPELKRYQEIVLEDNPGAWRDGLLVNSKKVLSLHYAETGEIDCIVLDSMIRGVNKYELWTRKIMRLYYPSIQTLQLETRTHNLRMLESLENTSPEVQLKALRLVFQNLRTALYSMDMLIAAYYDRRNKRNEWQINL
ncbi:MAG: hypothetical protein F9K24_04070 [Leptonema illini]|uniref:Uncharacterized protein n=2 Tax=Leptonema illini TaxID=183 RepID=H2CGD4_9LEPT|nr:hypothetical protein [Leptonema illini]EHQ06849.1 hypothetical protein Lepil_2172 [Leptonema illini DSM 21528]KAB2934209.1 MAG: hypothetical protein F9K24_04070 [Leptonema illini]